MTDTPEKPRQKTHAEAKAARLQAALRDNLRRRKAANVTPETPEMPEAGPDDGQNGV